MEVVHFKADALIITWSDQIEHLETIVDKCPEICFHIAAPVYFSSRILHFATKKNIRLHTVTSDEQIESLVRFCDVLLDINYGDEVYEIIQRFHREGKKVIAFDSTKHGEQGQISFPSHQRDEFVSYLYKATHDETNYYDDSSVLIQDGAYNQLRVGSSSSFIISENVICRSFESFMISSGKCMLDSDVFINSYCSFNCLERIEIGKGTMIGEGVRFYDHDHQYNALTIKKHQFNSAPIRVGENCWIGSNVTILKGVTIGDNAVIGANCLIRKNIPSNSIVYNDGTVIIKERK